MSNTRRACQPGWKPGTPAFDEWDEKRPEQKRVKSIKHQEKDRASKGKRGGKSSRFNKAARNERYNLQRKVEELQHKEQINE